MLKEKLDYYTLVAADDEFLDDFCKYCEETGKGGKNTGVGSSNSSIYDEKSVVL